MNEYTPDYWKVVRITSTEGEVLYKVFATWCGGYLSGDSWKLNSGIKKVTIIDNHIIFEGYSGSKYKVVNNERSYRTTMYSQSVLESMMKKIELLGGRIEELPFDTDWENLVLINNVSREIHKCQN